VGADARATGEAGGSAPGRKDSSRHRKSAEGKFDVAVLLDESDWTTRPVHLPSDRGRISTAEGGQARTAGRRPWRSACTTRRSGSSSGQWNRSSCGKTRRR